MSTENDATKTSSEDVVVDAPIIAEDDPTADGESMTSDAIVTGDDEEELSSTAPVEEEESKSVQDHDMADENDGKSVATTATPGEEEETKSVGTSVADNDNESATPSTPIESTQKEATPTTTTAADADAADAPPKKKRGKPQIPASARKGRAPAVKGLNIPFRTVKKAMKLDPDIPIVQNEAAIMTTLAAELFLKRLANQSQKICKNRGKNTIRYEDVADARANDPALAFLKTIIP